MNIGTRRINTAARNTGRRYARRPPRPAAVEALEERRLLALLEVEPLMLYPRIDYFGTAEYDDTVDEFGSPATLAIQIPANEPTSWDPTAGPGDSTEVATPRTFSINMRVDQNGVLIGGVGGHDLVVEGGVDADGEGLVEPAETGVLLTGEAVAFGFLEVGFADRFDFLFRATGGILAEAGMPYAGKYVGMFATALPLTSRPNPDIPPFNGSFLQSFYERITGTIGPIDPPEFAALSGAVFQDANNNGLRDAGEAGIAGVAVELTGTDTFGQTLAARTVLTDADGGYSFDGLLPGVYTLTQTQPGALLDGKETAGDSGGQVENSADSDTITNITLAAGQSAVDYLFGELRPASLSGFVYVDFNDDGLIDFGEGAVEGAAVTLTGADDRGTAVSIPAATDEDGLYVFENLRPGTYSITQTHPADLIDGQETLGTLGGVVANDHFSGIPLAPGQDGLNYNFGERPATTGHIQRGQTASIGFWHNKRGQTLLRNLNNGPYDTRLGNWLAATFPNIFGLTSGQNDLAGKTNAEVAKFYLDTRFKSRSFLKLDAQVMALALAVYVTNETLSGQAGAPYGFLISDTGVATSTFNVGFAGEAFAVADHSTITVLDALLATDAQSVDGVLYSGDLRLRLLATVVYTIINEWGSAR